MKPHSAPWQILSLVLAMLLPFALHAEDRSLPQIEQRIGAQLPLQEIFIDDNGQALRLAQLLDGKPVVLVPGYYHCTNVCSTLFQGALEALAASHIAPDAYRLLAVSIDPRDDALSASRKKAAWLPVLGSELQAHFLSGQAGSAQRLLDRAGWQVRRVPGSDQYLHPAGLMIITPDGRIARYFSGLRFDPQQLRAALQAARAGQTPGVVEQLWLLCGHAGRALGRHSAAAMTAVRLACLAVFLLGLAALWRLRRRQVKPS